MDEKTSISNRLFAYVLCALNETNIKQMEFPDNIEYIVNYLLDHDVTIKPYEPIVSRRPWEDLQPPPKIPPKDDCNSTGTPPKEPIKETEKPQIKTCNNCRYLIGTGMYGDQHLKCIGCIVSLNRATGRGEPTHWEPKE